ncbi:MAG: ABC transporter transmembrane domain-containing protein [Chitinophagales bacterium]
MKAANEVEKGSWRNSRDIFDLYRYVLPYKWQFLAGFLCLLATTSGFVFLPMGLTEVIDAAMKGNIASTRVQEVGYMLGGIMLMQAVLSFFRIYLFEIVSQRAMNDIRMKLYEKIITQPISFFERNRTGDLMSRLSADISQLQEALSTNLAMVVRQGALPLFSIPRLFMISPKLTFIMVASLPPLVAITAFFGRFVRKLSRKNQDAQAANAVMTEETISAADAVKIFTNESYEAGRMRALVDHVIGVALQVARFRAAFISFIIFGFTLCIMFIIYMGLSEVSNGHLTIGKLVEFLVFTVIIGTSLGGLTESFSTILRTIGASGRVLEILREPAEVQLADKDQQMTVNGSVAFRHVAFSYPSRSDSPIFRDLTFEVQPGQKIALVGPSGSGKSTIIKLLSGFYPLQSGEILVDGKNITSFNLTAFRKNLGIVPQEVVLFGGSIRENIAYGKTDATMEEIREAARQANALNFIEDFPEQFETLVGERGLKLSGGQKQRIAIARAILRNPKILILDEATSSLDSESERLVKEALERLMQGRTSFIIAHRFSTIREADKILVINRGKIVEQGAHQELMQIEGGLYANLLRLQYENS